MLFGGLWTQQATFLTINATMLANVRSEGSIASSLRSQSSAHSNFIVDDEAGIFLISMASPEGSAKEELKKYGAIVRHQDGTSTFDVSKARNKKKKISQMFHISPTAHWKEIREASFQAELKALEQKELLVRHRYKFAFLYVKEGQDQSAMFSNS